MRSIDSGSITITGPDSENYIHCLECGWSRLIAKQECWQDFARLHLVEKHDEPDLVNHPSHYRPPKEGLPDCITIIEALDLNFSLGSALKYIWRAGKKHSNVVEELRKAAWYCTREADRLEKS